MSGGGVSRRLLSRCFLFNFAVFPFSRVSSCFTRPAFVLSAAHVLLANFTFLLFTMNSALLLFFFGLGFVRSLSVWCQPLTSACLHTRKPYFFVLCWTIGGLQYHVWIRHLRSVWYKTWHRAQMQYEGEPVNCKMLDDGEICMPSSNKRCNECKKQLKMQTRITPLL